MLPATDATVLKNRWGETGTKLIDERRRGERQGWQRPEGYVDTCVGEGSSIVMEPAISIPDILDDLPEIGEMREYRVRFTVKFYLMEAVNMREGGNGSSILSVDLDRYINYQTPRDSAVGAGVERYMESFYRRLVTISASVVRNPQRHRDKCFCIAYSAIVFCLIREQTLHACGL